MGGHRASHIPADWENPAVFGVNKRKAHVPLRSYSTPDQVFAHYRLLSETPTTPRQLVLNGDRWKFKLFESPGEVAEGFWDASYDANEWDEVRGPRRFTRTCCAAPPAVSYASATLPAHTRCSR